MKKIIIVLAFLILPTTSFASGTMTVSPDTASNACDIIVTDVTSTSGHAWFIWDQSNNTLLWASNEATVVPNSICNAFSNSFSSLPDGSYYINEVNFVGGDGQAYCSNESPDWTMCLSQTALSGYDSFTISSTPPPSPSPSGVSGLIATASSTFMSDLGFNWINVTNLMKSQISLVMGTGLGMLRLMLPFVIVLVIITAIVAFIYRAFRFFKH